MSRETAHEYEESPDQKSKCFQEGRSAVTALLEEVGGFGRGLPGVVNRKSSLPVF